MATKTQNVQPTCTCGREHDDWVHSFECELWEDDDFLFGFAIYKAGQLVEVPNDHVLWSLGFDARIGQVELELNETRPAEFPDFLGDTEPGNMDIEHIVTDTPPDENWDDGYQSTSYTKLYEEIIPKVREEFPDLPPAEHAIITSDRVEFEQYDARYVKRGGIVGCFCGKARRPKEEPPGKDTRCTWCQVKRKHPNSPWIRTVERWNFESNHKDDWEENPNKIACACKPPSLALCGKCKVQRAKPFEAGFPDQKATPEERKQFYEQWPMTYYGTINKKGSSGGGSYQNTVWTSKDRHRQDPVKLPSGATLYCSSANGGTPPKDQEEFIPDLHVMLDGAQRPKILAWYVEWRDHGLPVIEDTMVLAVADTMLDMAKNGKKVEFGCIGGHGRTGCMLGIIYMKDVGPENTTGEKVVDWVRATYCEHAIEGAQQEHYMEYMRQLMLGNHELERPKKQTVVKSKSKSKSKSPKEKTSKVSTLPQGEWEDPGHISGSVGSWF